MKYFETKIAQDDLAGLYSMVFNGGVIFAATLAVWSLTANLNITKNFAVSSGLFSNWMVWVGIAIGLRRAGRHVSRRTALVRHHNRNGVSIPELAPSSGSREATSVATA